MPRLLIRALSTIVILCVGIAATAGTADAGWGGGNGGTSGSGIWADAWWQGDPQGPGPYIPGPSGGVAVCIWTDVGGQLTGLANNLSSVGFPASFWPPANSGYSPGAWHLLEWAARISHGKTPYEHFDVVACPNSGMVPSATSEMYTDVPVAMPPSGVPTYVWIFWDTVPDPPPGVLPPVIDRAYQEVPLLEPAVRTSPASVGGIAHAVVVNFPTWFWLDRSSWRTVEARAVAGGLVATVWAQPASVTFSAAWDFTNPSGNPEGGVDLRPTQLALTCTGPGTPYTAAASPTSSSPDCGTTFTQSTFGTWTPLTATVTWKVTWALTDLAGVVGGEGQLPDLYSTASVPLRALQVESVVSGG